MNEFMKILLSLSVSGTLLLLIILGMKLPLAPDITIVGGLFEKLDPAAITSEVSTSGVA